MTYDFVCDVCGFTEERYFRTMQVALKSYRCPQKALAGDWCPDDRPCSGKMRRQIGAGVGVVFRGSGFHCTDYDSHGPKSPVPVEKSE
jgi:predicted nucleic acid-binding Zn ribbon protein